jgi:transcriptional regulator with XRE-family HTH domain
MAHDGVVRSNGAAIKALRERSGMARAVLAGRADISEAHLRHIELGTRNASPETIRRIKEALVLDDVTAILLAEPEKAS